MKIKNNKRFWKIFGYSILTAVFLFSLWSFSLMFYNPFLSKWMIEWYSNDSNYNKCKATITEIYSVGYIEIDKVECLDEQFDWHYDMRIFSPDLEKTWLDFDPFVGMEFEFVASFRIFFDGGENALVQITKDENEILSFEDGKAAVLQWASTMH